MNGQIVIPNAPGLGLEWDEDVVPSASVDLQKRIRKEARLWALK
jgi:L-alanine-DL-glutamate epimerase-like enolase superfamily enzyme